MFQQRWLTIRDKERRYKYAGYIARQMKKVISSKFDSPEITKKI